MTPKEKQDKMIKYEGRLLETDQKLSKIREAQNTNKILYDTFMKEYIKEKQRLDSEMDAHLKTKSNLEKELGQLYKMEEELKVTDHALVQYLLRIKGIDVEALKTEMVSGMNLNLIDEFNGCGNYTNKEGVKFILRDNKVITLYEEGK
jgi:hypothetical protein